MNDTALTTIVESNHIDLAVAGWLAAHSASAKTQKAYEDTINQYRLELRRIGADLDSDVRTLGMVAQQFAPHSTRHDRASKRTINQRLAILSSFFQYALKYRLLLPMDDSGQVLNPLTMVDRENVQAYTGGAQPLDREEVTLQLASIDQKTKRGARDYALLAVLLDTTWRVSEVAGLRWRNVSISKKGIATLTYDHAKEDERIIADLSKATTGALLRWLKAWYGGRLAMLPQDAPLWVSLAHDSSYGKPLGKLSIANVCQKYLGVSQVHATRHTAAVALEDAGAPLSYIQKRLNHKNAATTSIYLERKRRGENKYGDAVAAMFGIE